MTKIDKLKEAIKSIKKITFSKHFQEKAIIRGITEEEIQLCLGNPENIVQFEYQGKEPEGQKYALIFNKSNKYDIKIVISVKEDLNVVTAHIQSKKKRKVLDNMVKMQK